MSEERADLEVTTAEARGMTRRSFLKVGGVGLAGVTLLGIAACSGGGQGGEVGGGGAGGNALTVGLDQEPQVLNLLSPSGTAASTANTTSGIVEYPVRIMPDLSYAPLLAEAVNFVGAVIAGRRTYDLSVAFWGPDGPAGPARVPVFIITHTEPEDVPEGGVYTFVTDGIESALEQAKAVAGEKDVAVMGGAEIGQQFIRAGLVDEISIHLVPVHFASGTRMFEHLGGEHVRLEIAGVIETSAATHLRFRIVK